MSGLTITVQDARLIATCLADVLEERGLTVPAGDQPDSGRVLDAVDVAGILGRSRDWVYEHKAELGGFWMGAGKRRRIGFDRERIDAWKRDHAIAPPPDPETRRRGRRRGPARAASTPDLIDFDS